jgi:hypothetical protein
MVEGQARLCFADDPSQHRIRVLEQVDCGNPQRFDPRSLKPAIPRFFPLRPAATRVRFPVDLDRKPRRCRRNRARKVRSDAGDGT